MTSGLSDADRARIGALPRGRGVLGLVIREARPIRTADVSRHPESYGFPPRHPPMKSFLGVPIVARDRVFGNLYVSEKIGGDEFDASASCARPARMAIWPNPFRSTSCWSGCAYWGSVAVEREGDRRRPHS